MTEPTMVEAPMAFLPRPAPRTGRWTAEAVLALMQQPFMALVHQAHEVHRRHFPAGDIELASLLSVKTGGCPEDCAYCP
ncbi:MAG: biotin synthase BioB, partial [Burkholderiales bacterium]|nr:biotin synthase BioB [Burkholderiales bacterium]